MVRSHQRIIDAVAEVAGRKSKYYAILIAEVSGLYQKSLRKSAKGCVRFSTKVLEGLYGHHLRELLVKVMRRIAVCVNEHYIPGRKCKTWKFCLALRNTGLSRFFPTKSRLSLVGAPVAGECGRGVVRVTVHAAVSRYARGRWATLCARFGWVNRVVTSDSVVSRCVRMLSVPADAEVPRCPAVRRHGRLLYPVVQMRSRDRLRCLVGGSAVAEIDVSSMFPCLLAMGLDDGGRVVGQLQSGSFYDAFVPAFERYKEYRIVEHAKMLGCLKLMRAGHHRDRFAKLVEADHDAIETMSVKTEWNRQCLMWCDHRAAERPLWDVLCKAHTRLANRIAHLRSRHTASELSQMLQVQESAIMIDQALPEIANKLGFALPIHDALMVRADQASEAKAILESILHRNLGFVPRVKISTSAP